MAAEGRRGKRQEEAQHTSEERGESGAVLEILKWMTEKEEKERLYREEQDRKRDEQFMQLIATLGKKQSDIEEQVKAQEAQRKQEEKAQLEKIIRLQNEEREAREREREREIKAIELEKVNREREKEERLAREEERRLAWEAQADNERRQFLEKFAELSLSSQGQEPMINLGKPALKKLCEDDDIEHFLTTFERVAETYGWKAEVWSVKLAPLLSGKAQAAYANMDPEKSRIYEEVKKAILRRYDINEETYRQRFRATRKRNEESCTELEVKLRDLYCKWVHPSTSTKEQISNAIIMEQLLSSLPLELQIWIRERKPTTSEEAAILADDYLLARKATIRGQGTQEIRCHGCKKTGHILKNCPVPKQADTTTAVGKRKPENDTIQHTPTRSSIIQCFKCGRPGHIALHCPSNQAHNNNNRGRHTGYYVKHKDKLIRSAQSFDFGEHSVGKILKAFSCRGEIEGRPVEILVDTGCSRTLVHKDLIPEGKVNEETRVDIQCAHGDYVSYPTAEVSIKIQDKVFLQRVVVSPNLPRPVLLGMDIVNDEKFERDEIEAFIVVTRAQEKAREQEEAIQLAREICSGAKARALSDASGEGNQSEETSDVNYEINSSTGDVDRDDNTEGTVESLSGSKEVQTAETAKINTNDENEGSLEMNNFSWSAAEIREMQGNDTTLDKCKEYAQLKSSLNGKVRFIEREGILYRQWCPDGNFEDSRVIEQLVLPYQCRKTVLQLAHDIPLAGHLGRKKTTARILQIFYWPRMFHDVAEYCRSCEICQRTSPRRKSNRAKLVPLPIVDTPFKRIAMDIVGPLERSAAGHKYILVICDYATRYPEAVPLRSIDAESVAEELVKLISRFGVPEEILTDQGSNFMSKLLQEVYKMIGVKSIRTSPYHPETDGLCERFNGTLKNMLRKAATNDYPNWDKMLPYLLFAYHEVPGESTGFSPFELLYGRQVRGPLDILKETWESNEKVPEDVVSYVLKMRENLSKMMEIVQENLSTAQRKQKTWYDKKSRVRIFKEGDEVFVLLPTSTNKLQAQWLGPYKVKRQVDYRDRYGQQVDYEIDMANRRRRFRIFHVNMLSPKHTAVDVSYWIAERENSSEDQEENDLVVPSINNEFSKDGWEAVKIEEDLSDSQSRTLHVLLQRFATVLKDSPGKTTVEEHQIHTGDAKPVRKRPYRLPQSQYEKIKTEIEKMEEMGIIQPSNSEWAAPRMMDKILKGMEKCAAAFLDDVIVFSATWEDHLKHLEEILTRISKAGLTANPKKCSLAMNEAHYLGHIVGNGKVRPEADKVKAVRDFLRPESKKQVRSFLGLTGYYRKFIPSYANIAAPLTDLTKKEVKGTIQWTDDCENAFRRLKKALRSSPVLRSPDYSKEFLLQTDASDRGLGAVLSQIGDDNEEHPVMYLSRKLLDRERRYAVVEKECLAIVWAIQQLRVYLYGRKFSIQTDHNALKWLDQMKEKNSRLTRWSLALQMYNYRVEYRRGQDNSNADTLSRI
eukprot:gene5569-9573_t